MDVRKAVGWAKGHRNVLIVAALVLVLAGADLLLNAPKGEGLQWLSVPFLGAGLAILILLFWPTSKPGPTPAGDTLAHRLLWWATSRGRLVPLFPVFGVGLVLVDLAYNAFVSSTKELLEHDLTVLMLGATLVAYRFVPERYSRERDFALLFTAVLTLILVIPLLVARLAFGDASASVDVYSSVALAPETSAILNLIGIRSTVVVVPGATAPGLTFTTAGGLAVTVVITTACSGLYSFAIFSSAFASFVLTEQRRLSRRVIIFFALGILFAYVANLLRMVVIILIGYRFDTPETGVQSMLLAHSNAGWIIFFLWIALFWFLLFKFLPPSESGTAAVGARPAQVPRRRGTFCGICGIVLTPAIPATRCQCGSFYHAECLVLEGRCPKCDRPSDSHLAATELRA